MQFLAGAGCFSVVNGWRRQSVAISLYLAGSSHVLLLSSHCVTSCKCYCS